MAQGTAATAATTASAPAPITTLAAKPAITNLDFTTEAALLSWSKVKGATFYVVSVVNPRMQEEPRTARNAVKSWTVKSGRHKTISYAKFPGYGQKATDVFQFKVVSRNKKGRVAVSDRVSGYAPAKKIKLSVVKKKSMTQKTFKKKATAMLKKCSKAGLAAGSATAVGGLAAIGISAFFPPAEAVTAPGVLIATAGATAGGAVVCFFLDD